MNRTTSTNRDGWLRLRFYLEDLRVGEVVTVENVTNETHLAAHSVDLVLRALARAGLFERRGDCYVRCHLDWS
jgi:hypothetical protein